VASGPDQPPAGPSRLAGSLARHRWVTAAGMTATIAAVAGGGLALARHGSSPGPPEECGLVPCAAALPASVQSGGDGSASAPATAAPTAAQRASTPSSPAPSPTSPAPPAAAREAAPPPDQLASAGPVSVPEPRSSCTTVIAFIARGTLSPVRCTVTDVARQQHSRHWSGHPGSGAAGQASGRTHGQLRAGQSDHDGWLRSWLGGWESQGWSGGGWSGGGWSGQHGGWPGGR
jgi:hypothetical protein